MVDTLYANGVIAVIERSLLGEKIARLAELSAEEAFRALTESGFGSGSEAASAADGELLCAAEERALDGFIREYAPDRAIAEYLLAPRDFHNMKALWKAKVLESDPGQMLAPEGLHTIEELGAMLESAPPVDLEEGATGAEIGIAFDRAMYAHLLAACKKNRTLVKLLTGKVDRLNLLTALRSEGREAFEAAFLEGGKLKRETVALLFEDIGKLRAALKGTPYERFFALCEEAKAQGQPFTAAERALGSFEAEYFAAHKYELKNKEPFLYYVFRRRAEIADVRILLVCLRAGLPEREIKKRLRTVS